MTRVQVFPIIIVLCVGIFSPSRITFAQSDEVPSNAAAVTTVEPVNADANADDIRSAQQALIIVVGSGGTAEYTAEFSKWAARWTDAAKKAEIQCALIGADQPAQAGEATVATEDLTSVSSDADQLGAAIQRLALLETSEPLWLVYIGHGTFDGRRAALNLRGTDVTNEQLAQQLAASKRPIVGVFCSSCSSPFVNALSGPNRVIISATKDGNQVQYCRFGDAFSTAIGTLEADINRDNQVSLLEAWLFASRRTAEFYSSEGRLASEHSLLDDNGDQKGTRAENYEGLRLRVDIKNAAEMDGKLSSRWSFVRSDEERKLTPEQRVTRDELESKLEALRERRDSMDELVYLSELETLLRPLAELYESAAAVPPGPSN